MKKKIVATLLASFLLINISSINVFANGHKVNQGSSQVIGAPAGPVNPSHGGSNNNHSGGSYGGGSSTSSSSSSSSNPGYSHSVAGSSPSNPIVSYKGGASGSMQDFINSGRNSMSVGSASHNSWVTSDNSDATAHQAQTFHTEYYPSTEYRKNVSTSTTLVSKEILYYIWDEKAPDPKDSKTWHDKENISVTFDKIGYYTFNSKAYIKLVYKHTEVTTYTEQLRYDNGHITTVSSTSSTRTWNTVDYKTEPSYNDSFYVTPEEVGPPHDIGPDVDPPDKKTKDDINWDTQMIR